MTINYKFNLWIFVLFLSGLLYSQNKNVYSNDDYLTAPESASFYHVSNTREVLDLCGKWEFKQKKSSEWENITIPASYDYVGTVIYRKKFYLSNEYDNNHFRLVSHGINYRAIIKINGVLIGNHIGGHSSFSYDIPESVIKHGEENTIEIEVDNNYYKNDSLPYKPQAFCWRNYNGLIREIYIEITPLITVEDVNVKYNVSVDLSNVNFNIRFKIQNFNLVRGGRGVNYDNEEVNYYFELLEYDNDQLLYRSEENKVIASIKHYRLIDYDFEIQNPPLWSIENPSHLILKIYLYQNNELIDEEHILTGIRKVEIKNNRLFLNNEAIDIIGIKRVENHPEVGCSFNYSLIEKDVLKIKNLGINTVYSAYHPHHPYFYYLCDKYGLLVFEEIPIWNLSAKRLNNNEIRKISSIYLEEAMNRDEKHPSIIFWSIMDNSQSTSESSLEFINELRIKSDKLKNKLLFHLTKFPEDDILYKETNLTIIDLDFLDINQFKRTIDLWKHKISPDKLIIFQFSKYLNFLDENKNFKPDDLNFQAKFILDRLRIIKNDPKVSGSMIDSYSDWKGQIPILINNPEQDTYLYSNGVLDFYRNERPAYQVIKKFIKNDEITDISFSVINLKSSYVFLFWGFLGIFVLLFLFKRYRNIEDNLKKAVIYPKSLFLDIRDRRLFTLIESIYIGLVISGTTALFFASICYYYRTNPNFDYFISDLLPFSLLKELFIYLVWNPLSLLVVFTLIIFIGIMFLGFLIHFLFIITGNRISLKTNLLIPIWAGSRIIILIPFLMIFYRLLDYSYVLEFSILIFMIFLIVYFTLVVKGYLIGLGYYKGNVFVIFFMFFGILLILIVLLYWESNFSLDYLRFLMDLINNRG